MKGSSWCLQNFTLRWHLRSVIREKQNRSSNLNVISARKFASTYKCLLSLMCKIFRILNLFGFSFKFTVHSGGDKNHSHSTTTFGCRYTLKIIQKWQKKSINTIHMLTYRYTHIHSPITLMNARTDILPLWAHTKNSANRFWDWWRHYRHLAIDRSVTYTERIFQLYETHKLQTKISSQLQPPSFLREITLYYSRSIATITWLRVLSLPTP